HYAMAVRPSKSMKSMRAWRSSYIRIISI
ncbi:MAG: hypothetical protein QOD80_1142, partial [Verrucomicrobiota bacterium]